MAKLKKMAVRGIRSFGPVEWNVIEFNTPLTLIVGANGTGKTTLIECLKYATTGSLPPNTKGGAFVFDPGLIDGFDSKGEIKLKFVNGKDEHMVCGRALQVTQRGGKQIQKTLESSIGREEGDTLVPLSSKLTEVDQEVPAHLGVYRPLLDSVIFCHQEESTWPLGEPRVLKERLDQIFCSVKYNKAVKNIKDARKGLAADIKLLEQRLEFLYKEKCKKESLEAELSELGETIKTKENRLAQCAEDNARLLRIIQSVTNEILIYEKIEINFRQIKMEFDNCKNFIKNCITPVLTDEEIFERCKALEATVGVSEENRSNASISFYLQLIKSAITKAEEKMQAYCLEEQEAAYQNAQEQADKYIAGLKDRKQRLERIEFLNSKIVEKRHEKAVAFDVLREAVGGWEDSTMVEISKKMEEKFYFEQSELRKASENLILKKKQKEELEKELAELVIKCGKFVNYNFNFDEEIVIDYDQLMDLEAAMYEKMEEHNTLQEQVSAALENIEQFNKVELINKELASKLEEHAKIAEKIQDGGGLTEVYMGAQRDLDAFNKKLNAENAQIESSKTRVSNLVAELMGVLGKRPNDSLNGPDRNRIEEEIANAAIRNFEIRWPFSAGKAQPFQVALFILKNDYSDAVNALLLGDETPVTPNIKDVEALQKELKEQTSFLSATTNASAIYKNFMDLGQKKHECPLCKTPLNEASSAHFLSRLSRVVHRMPEEVEAAEQKIEMLTAEIQRANKINAEITRKGQQLERVVEIKTAIQDELIKAIGLVIGFITDEFKAKLFENATRDIQLEILGTSELENNMLGKVADCLATILNKKALAAQQKCSEYLALQARERCLFKEISELKVAKEKMGPAFERGDDGRVKAALARAKEEMEAAKICYSQFRAKIKEQESLKKEREAAKEQKALLARKEVVEGAIKSIGELSTELDELRKAEAQMAHGYKRRALFESHQNAIQEADAYIRKAEEELSWLKKEDKPPEAFPVLARLVGANASQEMVEKCISQMKDALIADKGRYIEVSREAERLRAELRVAEDNAKLRQCKTRIMKVQEEFKNHDFERLSVLRKKQAACEEKRAALAGSEALLQGELKQLHAMHKSQELARGQYAEAPQAYAKCTVSLRGLELGSDDLTRCAAALDCAIAEFHQAKMDEVNAALRELWAETYRGNDVDYIELCSEGSETKAYNYSVQMVKNGTRMEMRGRCSAGQKMIASILIRLAIADTFSTGCNIIALDEPTTNLDQENIESLAGTLSRLIKERRDTQIVVISHDEDFIKLLSRDGIDYFYRLKRNPDGSSAIVRHSAY